MGRRGAGGCGGPAGGGMLRTGSSRGGGPRWFVRVRPEPAMANDPQVSRARRFVIPPTRCLGLSPMLAGRRAATGSDPDLRFFNSPGMNIATVFNLHAVIRFGDHIRHIVGQESARLPLP